MKQEKCKLVFVPMQTCYHAGDSQEFSMATRIIPAGLELLSDAVARRRSQCMHIDIPSVQTPDARNGALDWD
jgi:hypothetical protein